MSTENELVKLFREKPETIAFSEQLSDNEKAAIALYLQAETPLVKAEIDALVKKMSKFEAVNLLKTIHLGSSDPIVVVEEWNKKAHQHVRQTAKEKQGNHRYIINNKPVASGGMGQIFLGFDTKNGRRVAVKRIPPHLATPEYVDRLRKEAAVHARYESGGVVTVYDLIELPDGPAFVMRYIDPETSPTLQKVLYDKKSTHKTGHELHGWTIFSPEQLIQFISDISPGLRMMHRDKNYHFDLKPANIFMAPDGAILSDFGMANEVIDPDVSFGTPRYISPEKAEANGKADARSDLYSLSLIIYEMMVSKPLLTLDTPMGTAMDSINLSKDTSRLNSSKLLEEYCGRYGLNKQKVIDFFKKTLGPQNQRYGDIDVYLKALKSAFQP